MKKFLFCSFVTLCCLACQPVEEVNEKLTSLELSFEDSKYMIGFGETAEIGFTVSGIDGADVTADVSFLSNEWEASCTLDAASGKGVLTVTAPEKVGVTTAIVTVTDRTGDRQAEKSIALASSASGFGELAVAFASPSYTIVAGGDPVEVEYTVLNVGPTVIEVPTEEDVETTLTVNSITYDPEANKGKMVVAATESMLTGNVSLTLNVSDNYGRKGASSVEFTVTSEGDMPVSYNCYIVKPGSSVTFPSKFRSVSKVELAWQDAQSLIAGMSVADNEVTISTAAGIAGNALVLGKDDEGKTLWSWHVWVTDFDPEATAVTVNGVTFMDRNLGAVNALPGDVGAVGQAYQWGRKDPLPRITERSDPNSNGKGEGTCAIYDINNTLIPYLSGDTFYKNYQAGTIAASIEKAEYFAIRDPHTNAWFTKNETDFKNLWGGESGMKTTYDPCPQGWKVPVISNGVNPYAFMSSESGFGEGVSYDAAGNGHMYTTATEKLWFPVTGQRSRSKGAVHNPLQEGNYWMGTYVRTEPPTSKGYEYIICAYGQFNPTNVSFSESKTSRNAYLSTGLAVRCVKE